MLRIGSIVWGVRDVARATQFWSAALDYAPRGGDSPDWVLLKPRRGTGVQLALQEVRAAARERRRHHLDLYAFDQEAEVERLVGLGATRVEWRYEPDSDYTVLADPDGNYFCVIAAGEVAADPGLRLAQVRYVPAAAALPAQDAFADRVIRVLLSLQERELRAFLPIWRRFGASGLPLPASENEAYRSNEHLLLHVLQSSGSYLVWTCRQLGLPDPSVPPEPAPADVAALADDHVERLLERWRAALKDVSLAGVRTTVFTSNWGVPLTIPAMLEHAVAHPMRHGFQLEELLARRG